MMPDYHIHTSRCGHACGKMREYVDQAWVRGLAEIGFCDHVPMYWLPEDGRDAGLAMAETEFPGYVNEVLELRESCRPLNVRLGVEVDYIEGWEARVRQILSSYPFDYVIGSVHYIDGWDFDNPSQVGEYSRRDTDEIYQRYFEHLCLAAKSGLFDIMAHPDLIKKFGCRPAVEPVALYRQAARAFAESGVCVEVNTAGLRVPAGEIYPSLEFLRLCRMEGVPAVTGSDAHAPEQVGWGFSEAKALLKAAGYARTAVFEGRQRRLVTI